MRISIFEMGISRQVIQSRRASVLSIGLIILFVSLFQWFDVLHWSKLTPVGPNISDCSIRPHDTHAIWAQFFGAFLHGNFDHFLGNITSLFVLSALFLLQFPRYWLKFWILQHLVSTILLWSIGASNSSHIGASLWVYSFGFFLITTGVIHRDKASLSVMFMVFVWMGGFIWGLFPIDPKVSWEGHIAGSIAGIFLALSFGLRWKERRVTRLPAPEDPYLQFDVNQSDS
ncbi:MAG: rhomboid family intramembrane serine protease [Bacteroidetes bacterium]|nr:rhomboid family intramembrane serine protease [Bacteroidota bacterium]